MFAFGYFTAISQSDQLVEKTRPEDLFIRYIFNKLYLEFMPGQQPVGDVVIISRENKSFELVSG
jgi:hypothetical protein